MGKEKGDLANGMKSIAKSMCTSLVPLANASFGTDTGPGYSKDSAIQLLNLFLETLRYVLYVAKHEEQLHFARTQLVDYQMRVRNCFLDFREHVLVQNLVDRRILSM